MPELKWLGKETAVAAAGRTAFRLLAEDKELSYGDPGAGNLLVHGDNLEALAALLPYYKSRVKCIYIDPPYNTGSAFTQYDDNLEHATWLSLLYPRLELLREFLREDGSIWISIDDDEQAYLKVMCDEIFGRKNFVASAIWEKKYAPQNDAKGLSDSHDYILVYANNIDHVKTNLLPRTEEMDKRYKNPDNDPRGPWKAADLTSKTLASGHSYCIETPTGRKCYPAGGRQWAPSYETYQTLRKENRLWFGKTGNNVPSLKTFLSEVQGGMVPKTIWKREEVGDNQEAKKESVALLGLGNQFDTPKPERLIQRILQIATDEGDLVLDSFLGSGTTAAVAQKMGRRYIGIELEETAVTHVRPRLMKVIDGEQGGISKTLGWQGGGGFRFYHLGAPLYGADGMLSPETDPAALGAFIFFRETRQAAEKISLPSLGSADGTSYYLLYDKEKETALTPSAYAALRAPAGPKVIYADLCRMGRQRLAEEEIIFRQIPYDILKLGK